MMKILRRIICLVLSFAIMISLTSFSPATVEAAGYKKSVSTTYTVKCGDNGYWGTNVVDVDMKGDTPLKVTLKIESFNKVSKDNSITLRQYNEATLQGKKLKKGKSITIKTAKKSDYADPYISYHISKKSKIKIKVTVTSSKKNLKSVKINEIEEG